MDWARPTSAAAPAHPDATECAPKNAPVKTTTATSSTQILGTQCQAHRDDHDALSAMSTLEGPYFEAMRPAHGEVTVPIRYAKKIRDTTETGRLNGSSNR